ncbi:hypothetical protein [Herpetosiphon llansteffanensis]|uniref:hypothetical protein n=1 Tax=Herpetosiphon llansteffanensis TaxID=2094568 RepID=UPI000D7CEFAA|nr:hypothetical protein [Herpetosiphon llansteffanensis]
MSLLIALLPLFGLAIVSDGLVAPTRWRLFLAWLIGVASVVSPHLALSALALLLVGGLIGQTWSQRLSGVLSALGLGLLGLQADSWTWQAASVAINLNSIHIGLLIAGAAWAFSCWPWPAKPTPPVSSLALVQFASLLRLYSLVPLDWAWTAVAAIVGAGSALWFAWQLLPAQAVEQRRALVAQVLWCLVLASSLFASEAGIAAAWALALAACLAHPLFQRHSNLASVVPLAMALWLTAAASLAGDLALLSWSCWIVLMLLSLSSFRLPPQVSRWQWPLMALQLGLGLGLPFLLELLLKPVWRELGAGLTVFGRLDIAPWTGLATRNPGSQVVATLPSLVLAGLLVVGIALSYLANRWRGQPTNADQEPLREQTMWQLVKRGLPWGSQPRDE